MCVISKFFFIIKWGFFCFLLFYYHSTDVEDGRDSVPSPSLVFICFFPCDQDVSILVAKASLIARRVLLMIVECRTGRDLRDCLGSSLHVFCFFFLRKNLKIECFAHGHLDSYFHSWNIYIALISSLILIRLHCHWFPSEI